MLTEKQIDEIREHLEKAQNPLFFYDNDCDGLCSFLLLRKFLGRGKGVAIKSYPELNASYSRKARELNSDYVFILDKPVVDKKFFEEIHSLGLPVVWIDHHAIQGVQGEKSIEDEFSNLSVYNPTLNKGKSKSSEPVTYLCYKITNRKEDLWIALIGCVADRFMPDFAKEFAEEYPELFGKNEMKDAFDVYYKTEIGRVASALSFGLKDSVSNVVKLQNFLIECKNPNEVLSEMNANSDFRGKYLSIEKKYKLLLEKAKKNISGKAIIFDYSGELSINADLANELSYLYPEKYIFVAYKTGNIVNASMRGKNVREILERILKKVENASGGGHKDAVGARLNINNLEKFKKAFEEEILK